ncbi:metallophosphoesterase [Thalassospira xiamenensis]|uniref:Serine/threonine protein phosphatase 1 n=1 Tax=Thalassospira xiamenensis TaxID=220697 RepID=A0A285TRS4_9PROT|nr:metallophosphoesterase [Thalassospira xiamenensis]SOC26360.1 serine/threonine protein phosphatase 1 [Thalassospira xiamenensis]
MNVRRFERNTLGRDVVVGDIHGCFSVLEAALSAIEFDADKDRLFCVGDLIDRGPQSIEALRYYKSANCVRGNHEDMLLGLQRSGQDLGEVHKQLKRNGMDWWIDLTDDAREEFANAFEQLPLAIEVESENGLVGIVHAEVPYAWDWPTFIAGLNQKDTTAIDSALWGRERIEHEDTSCVPGVSKVFHGHTIQQAPTCLGNRFYVDTGCIRGLMHMNPLAGRLTVADLTIGPADFTADPELGLLFDARLSQDRPRLEISSV